MVIWVLPLPYRPRRFLPILVSPCKEDEGDECCVVEDAETPMVLDDGNRFDTVNVELFQCLNGMVEEPALGMGFTSEDDVRDLRMQNKQGLAFEFVLSV